MKPWVARTPGFIAPCLWMALYSPKLRRLHCCCLLVNQNRPDVSRSLGVNQRLVLLLGRETIHIALQTTWLAGCIPMAAPQDKHAPVDEPIKISDLGESTQGWQDRFGTHGALID